MTTATPLVQFPWPLILGGLVGLALVLALSVGAWLRGVRARGLLDAIAIVATTLAAVSAGAFLAMVWLWVVPMSRPVSCLYSCESVQFLSYEQLRQIILMTDLARILPVSVLIFGAVAVVSLKRGRRDVRPGPD